MRSLRAMWLAVTVSVALLPCGNGCPDFTAWRNATVAPDGALVCARIYGDTSCSGFPLPFAVNASYGDLHSDLASLETAESQLVALIRPGCHLRLWSEPDFHGVESSSWSYKWAFYSYAVLSAKCECESHNIELLRCEPRAEMVTIQECDYQSSFVGGICPYSVLLRPFRNSKGRSFQEWSTLTGDPITEDDVSAIKAMFPLHFDGRHDSPADDVVEKLVRHVAPRHKKVVKQKVLTCGAFGVPTSEVSEIDVDVDAGRWLSYRSATKHILISMYNASRRKAAADCSESGFVMASLSQPDDAFFAARIIARLRTFGWSSSRGYWTAALVDELPSNSPRKCRITWPGASLETYKRGLCSEKRGVLWLPNLENSFSYEFAQDKAMNHFICEKSL